MVAVDPTSAVHVVVPLNSSPGTPPRNQLPPPYVIYGLRSSSVVVFIISRGWNRWTEVRRYPRETVELYMSFERLDQSRGETRFSYKNSVDI